MNFELLIEDLTKIYKANIGKELSQDEAKTILSGLLSVRDTDCILHTAPRHLFQILFENNDFYGKCVYACDTVELRNILTDNKIQTQSRIILFNNSVAQRLIKDQKIHITINCDPCKLAEKCNCDVKTYGGIAILNTNCIDIKDRLNSIIINSNDSNIIEIATRISKDCKANCEVYAHAFVPGIDKYKFASKVERYKVNLPNMNIRDEISRATNEMEALENVLAYKWHWHPDKKLHKRKPERYTAEFWRNSGFFDSIVKKAESKTYNKLIYANQIDKKIKLTPQEQSIFETLLAINNEMHLGVTFRVAGGWVRDKLLNKPSDDIDIAIDKMTGQSFVNKAIEYKNAHPESPIDLESIYTVKQNVEKSKHLETTALDIAGLKIDFVNLRSETYGDSRVPQMQLSDDPKVDALRRDLTINSLFYNVNNQQIEDFVGGIQDLQNMVLRTPLDAKKTFLDDPLRILRVLRFNSRYPNSKIDPAIIEAMKQPEVQKAYRDKVAPERAGKEIIKMFEGNNVIPALRVLFDTNFDKSVFMAAETENLLPLTMDQRTSHHQHNLLEHTLLVVQNLDKIMKERNVKKEDRANMLLAALFHDYGKAHPEIGRQKENSSEYSYHGHEDKSALIADAVLKRIGVGEDDRKFINLVIREHMRPHVDQWSEKSMGKFLRETKIPGNPRNDIWELIMMHAQADTLASRDENQPDYDLKQQHIQQMHEYSKKPIPTKPLLDGSVIQKMFPTLSPKPQDGKPSFIKLIQNKLLDEQASSNILTQEDATKFVENMRGEIESMYNKKTQAFNMSKYFKLADASSGSQHSTGGRMAGEDTHSQWSGVKSMIYRKPGESSMIAVGDRYRVKSLGAAFAADKGNIYTVVEKGNNFVVLQNDNKKRVKVEIGIELPAKYIKV